MRAALLAPILLRVMKEGESKKAALILMKDSFCLDTTVGYSWMKRSHSNRLYSTVLFKWEFFIQMRATNLPPSSLYCPLFWWKERGIKGSSHLNENISFESGLYSIYFPRNNFKSRVFLGYRHKWNWKLENNQQTVSSKDFFH